MECRFLCARKHEGISQSFYYPQNHSYGKHPKLAVYKKSKVDFQ